MANAETPQPLEYWIAELSTTQLKLVDLWQYVKDGNTTTSQLVSCKEVDELWRNFFDASVEFQSHDDFVEDEQQLTLDLARKDFSELYFGVKAFILDSMDHAGDPRGVSKQQAVDQIASRVSKQVLDRVTGIGSGRSNLCLQNQDEKQHTYTCEGNKMIQGSICSSEQFSHTHTNRGSDNSNTLKVQGSFTHTQRVTQEANSIGLTITPTLQHRSGKAQSIGDSLLSRTYIDLLERSIHSGEEHHSAARQGPSAWIFSISCNQEGAPLRTDFRLASLGEGNFVQGTRGFPHSALVQDQKDRETHSMPTEFSAVNYTKPQQSSCNGQLGIPNPREGYGIITDSRLLANCTGQFVFAYNNSKGSRCTGQLLMNGSENTITTTGTKAHLTQQVAKHLEDRYSSVRILGYFGPQLAWQFSDTNTSTLDSRCCKGQQAVLDTAGSCIGRFTLVRSRQINRTNTSTGSVSCAGQLFTNTTSWAVQFKCYGSRDNNRLLFLTNKKRSFRSGQELSLEEIDATIMRILANQTSSRRTGRGLRCAAGFDSTPRNKQRHLRQQLDMDTRSSRSRSPRLVWVRKQNVFDPRLYVLREVESTIELS